MQRQGSRGGSAAIRVRVTGGVLLAAHLAFVAWYTLRPLDVPWVMPANLHPLAGIRADLALGWPEAARSIGAGLGLLAPLGVLLPMVGGRPRVSPLGSLVRTVAAGALISLGIELLQTGVPGQVVDVDSLLLNTTGVTLTHVAVVPAGRYWLRRRALARSRAALPPLPTEDAPQGRTPTIPRVGIAPWSDALPPSSP
ncbi:VanZ family protein [Streptomyces spinoverrucosus]|uniref:VanZ family protein n=1 Tax=Streptomyces spinoverrucosus TaxID=284043 RepID=UPI0018C3987D|nr:VanZ family protein [Streptomyces spinoverrucosus]MBG0852954.1 VanZ family protein [Streptomyces spinoverrucosus]